MLQCCVCLSAHLSPLSSVGLSIVVKRCVLEQKLQLSAYRKSYMHRHHHFMLAPLAVHSAKRRHQSPEWTILSHVDCFIQGEVIGFQAG